MRKVESPYDELGKMLGSYPPAGVVGTRLGDQHNFFVGRQVMRIRLVSE